MEWGEKFDYRFLFQRHLSRRERRTAGRGAGGSGAEGWCAGVSASKRGEGREDEFVHLLFGSFIMRNTFICVWSVVSGRRGERGGAPAICQLLAIN